MDQRSLVSDTRCFWALSALIGGDSARLCLRAASARAQLRDRLLRYGLRRVHLIRGGSDVAGAGVAHRNEDHRHLLRRAVAAHYPVPLHVGPSVGTICMFCREAIVTGALQYETKAGGLVIVADDKCYTSFLLDIVKAPPTS